MALKLPVDGVPAQIERIVDALKSGECTNDQLIREHDIPSPTKRISEMRALGWSIIGRRATAPAADGKRLHRGVMVYRLDGEDRKSTRLNSSHRH